MLDRQAAIKRRPLSDAPRAVLHAQGLRPVFEGAAQKPVRDDLFLPTQGEDATVGPGPGPVDGQTGQLAPDTVILGQDRATAGENRAAQGGPQRGCLGRIVNIDQARQEQEHRRDENQGGRCADRDLVRIIIVAQGIDQLDKGVHFLGREGRRRKLKGLPRGECLCPGGQRAENETDTGEGSQTTARPQNPPRSET